MSIACKTSVNERSSGRPRVIAEPTASVRPMLLIVDDHEASRRALYFALRHRYRIQEASDSGSAMEALAASSIDLVLLDLHLPPHTSTPEEGVRMYRHIRTEDPDLPVIVVTGDQDRRLAIEMTRQGVNAFLQKPVDPHQLEVAVDRALASANSERALSRLQSASGWESGFGGLVATSPETRRLFSVLRRLACTSTTILLLGESGTGKSAFAEAIHRESPRGARPFVRLDVTAAPEGLIESELFGHTRGAFTGAGSDREGRIRQAEGGTLFLDEIGNVPLAVQSKLLGFLDTRTYIPVGGNEERQADVRVIAATNSDLEEMSARGAFREDLMYRLLVATIEIPPLRRRRADIPALAAHIVEELARGKGVATPRLRTDAIEFLQEQSWPGNVRQLRSVLETTLHLMDEDEIGPEHIRMVGFGRAAGESAEAESSVRDAGGGARHRLLFSRPVSEVFQSGWTHPMAIGSAASARPTAQPAPDALTSESWTPGASMTPDSRPARARGTEPPVASPPSPRRGFKELVASFERGLLEDALFQTRGNKAAAGRLLGLDDNQIRYYCRKHGL